MNDILFDGPMSKTENVVTECVFRKEGKETREGIGRTEEHEQLNRFYQSSQI